MTRYRDILAPRRACTAALSNLASQMWCIEGDALAALFDEVSTRLEQADAATLREIVRAAGDETDWAPAGALHDDGDAHIDIRGPMMRHRSAFLDFFGIEHTSTVDVRRTVEAAAANPDVRAIVLHVDSPGGAVSGTVELADAVAAAAKVKPVKAVAEGAVASAAYWVASQAHRLDVERSTAVGSLGAFARVADTSALAKRAGVKVHVLRSGPHKGAGTFGEEITDEQLSAMQANVDQLAGMFLDAVERSRGDDIENLEAIFDGRVFFGEEAVSLGLADCIHKSAGTVPAQQPDSGTEGAKMDEKQLAQLVERIEALEEGKKDLQASLQEARDETATAKAEAEALRAANAESAKSAMARVIADGKASGRVVGDVVAAVEGYAEAVKDPAAVEAFIAKLPVQTRPDPRGEGGEQDVSSQPANAEEARWCRLFGSTPKSLANVKNVAGFVPGKGVFATKKGSLVESVEEAN